MSLTNAVRVNGGKGKLGYPKSKGNYALGWVERKCDTCGGDMSYVARKSNKSTKTTCDACQGKSYRRRKKLCK